LVLCPCAMNASTSFSRRVSSPKPSRFIILPLRVRSIRTYRWEVAWQPRATGTGRIAIARVRLEQRRDEKKLAPACSTEGDTTGIINDLEQMSIVFSVIPSTISFQLFAKVRVRVMYRCRYNILLFLSSFDAALIPDPTRALNRVRSCSSRWRLGDARVRRSAVGGDRPGRQSPCGPAS